MLRILVVLAFAWLSAPAAGHAQSPFAPVAAAALADLAGDDGRLERNAQNLHRSIDEIPVRVGENRKSPAAASGLLESRTHVLEHRPGRQRASQRARVAFRQGEPRLGSKPFESDGQDLAVRRALSGGLDPRLELVVADQKLIGTLGTEELLELLANASVPVDERAVAIEGRPPLHTASLICDR